MTDIEFWQARYEAGDIRWDKGAASPGLVEFLAKHPLCGRILVPGCGSGHDVREAARRNPTAQVLGFDLAPAAAALAATYDNPTNVTWRTGDFLNLATELKGAFDWMIEHTLFCAIPPARRPDYAASSAAALKPGGHLLAVFYMTPDNDDGTEPPYGCTSEELDALFLPNFELLREWTPSSFFESRIGKEKMRLMRRK